MKQKCTNPYFSGGEGKEDNITAKDPNESLFYPQPNIGTLHCFAYSRNLLQIWHNLNHLHGQAIAFLGSFLGAEIEILRITWHNVSEEVVKFFAVYSEPLTSKERISLKNNEKEKISK